MRGKIKKYIEHFLPANETGWNIQQMGDRESGFKEQPKKFIGACSIRFELSDNGQMKLLWFIDKVNDTNTSKVCY